MKAVDTLDCVADVDTVAAGIRHIEKCNFGVKVRHRVLVWNQDAEGYEYCSLWCYASKQDAEKDYCGYSVLGTIFPVPVDTDCDETVN